MTYLDLLRQGDEHAARAERVAAYQEAARLRSDDPIPYLRLARVYLDWGRTDDALTAVAEAERLGAREADFERLRLAIHIARADWPAVVEHAQRLLALLAGADPAAIRHLFAARTDLADNLLGVLREMGTIDDPAYASALLGRACFEAQEWALAVWLREAVSLEPDDPALWEVLARFYLDHNITTEGRGVEAASELVKLLPDDAGAYDLRGWAAFQVGCPRRTSESARGVHPCPGPRY